MISLALYFLAALGLAFVVGFSKISLPFRVLLGGQPSAAVRPLVPGLGPFLVALLECPGCFGFWEGVGAWFARAQLSLPISASLWSLAVLACATAASNLIGAKFAGLQ